MDPYRFVRYITTFGRVTFIWPLGPKASRFQIVFHSSMWFIIFSNNGYTIVNSFHTLYVKNKDLLALSNRLSLTGIAMDSFLQMILVRIQWPRLQILIHEVTEFMRCAKSEEKIICQKYIKRHLGYQCFFAIFVIGPILAFASRPVLYGKRFPIDARYPFSLDPLGNRIFVYFVQFVMILQPLMYLSHDCIVMTIIWYSTVRFELLGKEFCQVKTSDQFRDCVKKHKELLRFVRETKCAITLALLKSMGFSMMIIVGSVLLLSQYHDFTTLSQYFLISMCATGRVYGTIWAVDDLTEMAGRISWAIYQPEVFAKPSLGKNILIVMQMSQRSMAFTLWGLELTLSLKLFAKYVLQVFSFYMTMRVVVDRYIGMHPTENNERINTKLYKV